MDKFLTIVIPTYNRKDRLLRQLNSLKECKHLDWYYLVILDNHSEYEIRKSLRSEFSKEFDDNIEVIVQPYNTGIGYNIASCFMHAKTKWLWTISDDDITPNNALDIIYSYCQKYPNAAIIEYSLALDCNFEDQEIFSVNDLENAFDKHLFTSGDLMFIGNNVYNCEIQQKYFGDNCIYHYTQVPQIISTLKLLSYKENLFVLSSSHIQNFMANTHGDSWHSLNMIIAICSLYDIKWRDYKENRTIADIIMRHFSVWELLSYVSQENDYNYKVYAFNRLKNTAFRRKMSLAERLKILFFEIQMKKRLPLFTLYCKIRRVSLFNIKQ